MAHSEGAPALILGAFREALRAGAGPLAGRRLMAAVSGGGDSVAMLHLLVRIAPGFPFTPVVAHVNHGMRGAAADGDERFVRDLSSRLGLECRVLVPAAEAKRRMAAGGEEALRAVRHALLRRAAADSGCARIALAHTLDDQAETFLMRIVRGAGRRGLSAMAPFGPGPLIRPMLGITRRQARSWLERIGEPWREDETNVSERYLRNRLRRRVMPLLQELNPRIVERLAGTAALLADEDRYLDALAGEWIDRRAARDSGGALRLPLRDDAGGQGLAGLPAALARRVIRLGLEAAGGEPRGARRTVVDAVIRLAGREGLPPEPVYLSGGMAAHRDGADLVIRKRPVPPPGRHGEDRPITRFVLELPIPGRLEVGPLGGELSARIVPRAEAGEDHCGALRVCLDASRFGGTASVRNRLPGDLFHPLGGAGRRKLADFMIDRKIPRNKRDRILLVLGDVGIAWVVGERIGHPYRLTGATGQVLVLEYRPCGGAAGVDRG